MVPTELPDPGSWRTLWDRATFAKTGADPSPRRDSAKLFDARRCTVKRGPRLGGQLEQDAVALKDPLCDMHRDSLPIAGLRDLESLRTGHQDDAAARGKARTNGPCRKLQAVADAHEHLIASHRDD